MSRVKQFFDRWKTDYDFKTVTAALGSLFVTALFALYNGFLGVYHASLWHGSICVYYLVLVGLRTMIIAARKNAERKADLKRAQKKVYIASAALLLFLNLCLVVPVSLMVLRQKPVNMSLIPAIAMAAYTTYKVVMASVNLKRRKRSSNRLVRLLRTISFIDALVSVLSLQNTLIMVNMKDDGSEMLTLTAITSAAIMLTVLVLSVVAMIKGVAGLKSKE
ncbi:MAG: hypothetical protein II437_05990 [Oscillospiraceae bacterium]|nr:hypothetical protein [Oscillospiraceae bacterium]